MLISIKQNKCNKKWIPRERKNQNKTNKKKETIIEEFIYFEFKISIIFK